VAGNSRLANGPGLTAELVLLMIDSLSLVDAPPFMSAISYVAERIDSIYYNDTNARASGPRRKEYARRNSASIAGWSLRLSVRTYSTSVPQTHIHSVT
jgi:hypothetical protein